MHPPRMAGEASAPSFKQMCAMSAPAGSEAISCLQVENYLKRNAAKAGSAQELTVLPCHSAIEDSSRAANLKAFLAAPGDTPMALV